MIVNKKGERTTVEYKSLTEFYDYITNTEYNSTFKDEDKSSITGSYVFTHTNSFEEAVDLFKFGWPDISDKLTNRLKTIEGTMEKEYELKNIFDVQGYQAVVPLYINGVPTNMISRKPTKVRQKIITINKDISYSARVSTSEIIESSTKAMAIIKKLESQGYRCNFNIILGVKKTTFGSCESYTVKVRIKSANERLNISKLAFPLVHPSMLRRLFFRFIEVYPTVSSSFVLGYGYPQQINELKTQCEKEVILPKIITKDVNKIKSVDELMT